ncbi:FAD-binding domain-containing protein [Daldinia vernicosa]|uniref:FAD-binding domain-containing protein n=1 Tax=Daldinia vernicosa TaxID=114800 RepID=UPI002007C49F|nr:FAD-binding domain-containing protein [Daldinia vernicosa]KAI0850546.1 FAD-binding domain-containing protein [Daldinia vernicosa]
MAVLSSIMSALSLLSIIGSNIVLADSTSQTSAYLEHRDNMSEKFEAFYNSIGLSEAQAETLKEKYGIETTDENSVEAACTAAQLSLGASIVDTAPLNQTVVGENWSKACIAEPYCIVQPKTAEDVSKVIKTISYYGVKFAVRSGGHSPNPGWSSVGQGGILVDLQNLNQISLSCDKKVASVGPGARWGEVISTLDAQGATVIGGRVPSVGVAGVILGGGYFHFTGQFGTAADNVKNFEIVLSDGTITNASSTVNPDLFWALKGGGPNFGIVTRFDLYTVPVRGIWYQASIYSVDQADALLEAYAKWQQNEGATDLKATVGLGIGLDSISLGLVYSEPTGDQPSVFAPFRDIEPLMVAVPPTNGSISALTAIMASTGTGSDRHDYRAASTRIDAQLYKDVHAFWREKALAVRDATGANQTFTVQPVPKNVAVQGEQKGGNPMNILKDNHGWWTTIVDWNDEKDDDLVRSVSIETSQKWKQLGDERGLSLPFTFMNDASRDQNPLASYGTESVNKLKQISQKYDASQLFQKQQNDGFLLSKL